MAVQPPPANGQGSVAAGGLDLGAHAAEWLGDAAHRAAEQLPVAGERAGERLPRQDARQQAHRCAGAGAVQWRGGRPQSVQSAPVDDERGPLVG